jgi:hypothetical protein
LKYGSPFGNNILKFAADMIHIGSLIEQELRRQDWSAIWLADELHCGRANVYKLFKKKSIDTLQLEKISVILQHNFFLDYADEVKLLLR